MIIEEILQERVNVIRKTNFADEHEDSLKFEVGLLIGSLNEKEDSTDKIVLSINHHGLKLSRILFPKISHFDYESLEDEMKYLYNATM